MDRTGGIQQQPVEPAVRFRDDNPADLARATSQGRR